MQDDTIIEAIQETSLLGKGAKRLLELFYKTSINNESHIDRSFMSSKLQKTKSYVSGIIQSLVEKNFIRLKYKERSHSQTYILNREKINIIVKCLELRRSI